MDVKARYNLKAGNLTDRAQNEMQPQNLCIYTREGP